MHINWDEVYNMAYWRLSNKILELNPGVGPKELKEYIDAYIDKEARNIYCEIEAERAEAERADTKRSTHAR
jgi:hypothetical protein